VSVAVRRGRVEDAELLAELGARLFREAFAADNDPADLEGYIGQSYGVSQQAAELGDAGGGVLLAEADGRVVGYAQLRAKDPPECVRGPSPLELWRFYVDRPWQGKGVAAALMQAVREEAVLRGASTLWLGVWQRNDRAKAFYRRCGFLPVGTQAFRLGRELQTDVVMALAL